MGKWKMGQTLKAQIHNKTKMSNTTKTKGERVYTCFIFIELKAMVFIRKGDEITLVSFFQLKILNFNF